MRFFSAVFLAMGFCVPFAVTAAAGTPSATLTASQTAYSFNSSDILSFSSSVQAGSAAGLTSDVYLAANISGYGTFYLGPTQGWSTVAAPVVSGFRLTDISAPNFPRIPVAGLPAATYVFSLIVVPSGSAPDSPADRLASASAVISITPPTPPSGRTSGVVIGSYFRNALVCMDVNGNGACDPGEPSGASDNNGRFTVPGSGRPLVAEIGTDAIQYDPDANSATPVSGRIILRAPAEAPGVISLHSTSVVSEMETGALSFEAARQKVASLLGVDAAKLLQDFNTESDAGVKRTLKSASSDGLTRIQLALASAKPADSTRGILASASGTLDKIRNVVVISLENRSFDNLYGLFPGANGIANALANPSTYQQVDRDGVTVLPTLPPVWNAGLRQAEWSFVGSLPNRPFQIDAQPGLGPSVVTPDLVHRFDVNKMQVNGGRNNMFAAWSDAGGLAMGYYDGSSMRMWQLARQYTLADNFFQGAFGNSFLNHFWLVCACTPVWPNPPLARVSNTDSSGTQLAIAANSPARAHEGMPAFTAARDILARQADGNYYAVGTSQPAFQPSGTRPAADGDARLADPSGGGEAGRIPLPPQALRTIGDTLTAKGTEWKWYAGGWNQALADPASVFDRTSWFEPHHHPLSYFSRFNPTTAAGAADRAAHFKDYTDLLADIQKGSLPPVAFYKPQGNLTQHPYSTDILSGDAHAADLVARLQASPQWRNMLIIVTYDENGGFWDHVAPPRIDQWGPGTRVPTILISPYAKRGYVDSALYDTTSILKFLTRRFGLEPLPGARKAVSDLSNSLDMSQ